MSTSTQHRTLNHHLLYRRAMGFARAGALGLLLWLLTPDSLWAHGLQQNASGGEQRIWPILLTLITAAFVVERLIEVVWNYLEWLLLSFQRWTPATVRSPQYMQFKSGTSLLVGAILGVLIANVTTMRLFSILEPLTPGIVTGISDTWDIVLTGLMIGAIAKPLHDIVGIFAQTKTFLGNAAIHQREEAGAALAEGVLRLAQSDTETMIDVPGVGPTRLHAEHEDGSESDDAGDGRSATDSYIDTLRDHTSM